MKLLNSLVLSGLLLVASPIAATAHEEATTESVEAPWIVDKEASGLVFSGTQTGKAFSGTFSDFNAEITLDPDHLDAASIIVTVRTKSAVTGDRQRDSALPGKDWFDEKNHPTAIFQSDSISKAEDGTFVAKGALSLRGISKELELPFTLNIEDGVALAEGSVQLIR